MREVQNSMPISQESMPMFPREIKKNPSSQSGSDYSVSDQKTKKCFSIFCDSNPLNQDYRRVHRPQEPIQVPGIQNQPRVAPPLVALPFVVPPLVPRLIPGAQNLAPLLLPPPN